MECEEDSIRSEPKRAIRVEAAQPKRAPTTRAGKQVDLLTNSLPIGVYRASSDGRIIRANPALVGMLELPAEEALLGMRISDFFYRLGDAERLAKQLQLAGFADNLELPLRTASGNIIWSRLTIQITRDDHARPSWIEGIVHNITDERAYAASAEKATRWLELRALVPSLLDDSAQSPDRFLQTVAAAIEDHVAISCWFLLEERRRKSRGRQPLRAYVPPDKPIPHDLRTRIESPLRRVLTRGEPLTLSNTSPERSWRVPTNPSGKESSGNDAIIPLTLGTGRWCALLASDLKPEELEQLVILCAMMSLKMCNSFLSAEVEREKSALRSLAESHISAQEAERARVARELHDEIGQSLTALEFGVQSLKQAVAVDDSARTRKGIRDMEQLTSAIQKNVRELAMGLRPAILDDLGLQAALEWFVESFASRASIHAVVELDTFDDRLPRDMEIMLYRLTQESLNNAARHADATEVVVRIATTPSHVLWTTQDNGKGFEPEGANGAMSVGRRGIGLLDMQERVRAFGGKLEIQSSRAMGTSIQATIPLPKRKSPANSSGEGCQSQW